MRIEDELNFLGNQIKALKETAKIEADQKAKTEIIKLLDKAKETSVKDLDSYLRTELNKKEIKNGS